MKKLRIKLAAALMCIVGFFLVLGIAGDYDYTEQVILRMSYDDYDYVKDSLTKKLGKKPSDREIAHWWVEHHNDIP